LSVSNLFQNILTELVKLEHVDGDGRLRRDASDFPNNLEYSFNLNDTVKSLRLKRNTYVRDYIPLTLRGGDVNKRLTGYEEEVQLINFSVIYQVLFG